jgi:hypothetical protein
MSIVNYANPQIVHELELWMERLPDGDEYIDFIKEFKPVAQAFTRE